MANTNHFGQSLLRTVPLPAITTAGVHDRRSASRAMQRLLTTTTAAYVSVLLWTTHAPRIEQPEVHVGRIPPDKLLHFSAYAVLGTLAAMTANAWNRIGLRMLVALLATLAAFALADEGTQPFFGRTAEALDWATDVAGIAIALALWACCWQVACRLRKPAG